MESLDGATAGGVTTVRLDYPIKTVNVANDKEMWQMDAGPLCLPLAGTVSPLDLKVLTDF